MPGHWVWTVGTQVCVAVASCKLPPLLARIRKSAQSQPTACTARPGSTPSQGSIKVQSLTRLPTLGIRPSASTVPTTGNKLPCRCCNVAARVWLGAGAHRRHRPRASTCSTKTCTCPRAAIPLTQTTPSLLLLSLLVAAVLCSLPMHYCPSGMCLCRSCGNNIGPLGDQLDTPSASGLGVAIRSPSCASRIHQRSRLRDL